MNQDKLDVIKKKMARVNIKILAISELKWMEMGKFNSDAHYIYNCDGQEGLVCCSPQGCKESDTTE